MLQTETTLPTNLNPIAVLSQAIRRARDKGVLSTARRISFLANELYWERRLGIDTADCIPREMLSDDPASIGYDPIGYRQLNLALSHARLHEQAGTFLDYGCGKGRVICRAAMLPFDQIIGVEISDGLCDEAQENVNRLTSRAKCRDIDVINTNAATFAVPNETTNIFLFNPFTGHLLEGVVEQIHQSLSRQKRDLTILYILPCDMSDIFAEVRWTRETFSHSWDGLKLHVHQSVVEEL